MTGRSIGLSVLLHLTISLSVVGILHWKGAFNKDTSNDYVDLDYQMFDAPPADAPVEKQVMRSPESVKPPEENVKPDEGPKELQDEASDVAGTQEAKQENNMGSDSDGSATATPYYKIKPKYPKAALMAGVEGWVLLQIDINEDGSVDNVRVVNGEGRNMFQAEARRAVLQWKYRPFTDPAGQAHKKIDHQVRVDFKLTDVAGQ